MQSLKPSMGYPISHSPLPSLPLNSNNFSSPLFHHSLPISSPVSSSISSDTLFALSDINLHDHPSSSSLFHSKNNNDLTDSSRNYYDHAEFNVHEFESSQEFVSSMSRRSQSDATHFPSLHRCLMPILFKAPSATQFEKTYALADTGCDILQASLAFCRRFALPLLTPPVPTFVKMGDNLIPIASQVSLTLRAKGITITSVANVVDQVEDLLLGEKERSAFGIHLVGLPFAFDSDFTTVVSPSSDSSSSEPTIDEADLQRPYLSRGCWEAAELCEDSIRAPILAGIHEEFTKNNQIKVGSFSTHPKAPVDLNTGNHEPVYRTPYPMSDLAVEFISKWLSEKLEAGTIVEGNQATRWLIPIFITLNKQKLRKLKYLSPDNTSGPHPDEAIAPEPDDITQSYKRKKLQNLSRAQQLERYNQAARVCVDARWLNDALSEPFVNNLPDINEIIQRLGKFNILSQLDLKQGYHHCRVKPEDQDKLSFKFQGKVYKWAGAPFGVAHFTHHFQALMEEVLMEHSAYCMVYVDDIFIYSNTPEEHIAHINAILRTLTRWNFKVNHKCNFAFQRLKILGHMISTGGAVTIDPEKAAVINKIPKPTTGKGMEEYLGLVTYVCKFIPFAQRFTLVLNKLKKLKTITPADWLNHGREEAWLALKEILRSPPVLSLPVPGVELQVAVDASQFGVGACLFQDIIQPDGTTRRQYIEFASMSFAKYQRNYSAPKRELLAIMFGLRRFHSYLFGHKFRLWTDHRALMFLFSTPQNSYMLNDWIATMMEYTFHISHCPGINNIVPDYLSRLYSPSVVEYPPPNLPSSCQQSCSNRSQSVDVLQPSIDSSSQPIPRQSVVINELLKYPDRELRDFIQERCNKDLPDRNLWQQLIDDVHADGHYGAEHVFQRLFNDGNYFWPGMRRQITDTIATCVPCLKYNISRSGFNLARPRLIHEVLQCMAIDLGEFPTSVNGYNYFIVLVDVCSGFTFLEPIKSKDMLTIGRALYKIFSLVGYPRELQHDGGDEFVNDVVAAINSVAKIESRQSAPYNPRCNGAAEARVKSTKQAVRKAVNGNFSHWDTYIPAIQLAINTKSISRTGTSPFTLLFHRSSPILTCADAAGNATPMPIEEVIQRGEYIKELVFPEVFRRSDKAKQEMALKFDSRRARPSNRFRPGAAVFVRNEMRSSKNDPAYDGPLIIYEVTASGTLRLSNLDGTAYGPPVTVDRLKLTKKNYWKDLQENAYTVEYIMDSRQEQDGSHSYFVHWKGYDASEDSWVKAEDFFADKLIKAYWFAVRDRDATEEVRRKFPHRKLSVIEKLTADHLLHKKPRRIPLVAPILLDDEEATHDDVESFAPVVLEPPPPQFPRCPSPVLQSLSPVMHSPRPVGQESALHDQESSPSSLISPLPTSVPSFALQDSAFASRDLALANTSTLGKRKAPSFASVTPAPAPTSSIPDALRPVPHSHRTRYAVRNNSVHTVSSSSSSSS